MLSHLYFEIEGQTYNNQMISWSNNPKLTTHLINDSNMFTIDNAKFWGNAINGW